MPPRDVIRISAGEMSGPDPVRHTIVQSDGPHGLGEAVHDEHVGRRLVSLHVVFFDGRVVVAVHHSPHIGVNQFGQINEPIFPKLTLSEISRSHDHVAQDSVRV